MPIVRRLQHRVTAALLAAVAVIAGPARVARYVVTASLIFVIEQWVPDASAAVYHTADEALTIVFPDADRYWRDERPLTERESAAIAAVLGELLPHGSPPVYAALRDGAPVGYAVVLDEIGKHRPITFMVGVTPSGAVHEVLVMAFRESRGWEVKRRRFLKQFQAKRWDDPIRLREDIQHVTGATLSCRAATVVVRRALAIQRALYGPDGTRTVPAIPTETAE